METPTFEIQYQKIVSAYYKDELDPNRGCACFIGNLLNKSARWQGCRNFEHHGKSYSYTFPDYFLRESEITINRESKGLYSTSDIVDLENNFLEILDYDTNEEHNDMYFTEENLFKAMESTLEMLKKIHESKGEIVQEYNFTKRKLEEAL